MRVAKWGNSLAIRLPARLVQALGLKEGDHIEIHIAEEKQFKVSGNRSRQEAIEQPGEGESSSTARL